MIFHFLPFKGIPLQFSYKYRSAAMIYRAAFIFLIYEAIIPDTRSIGCDNQALFDTHKGARLLNSVIENIPALTLPDCIYKCIEKKLLCLSINYQHGNSDVNQCYLNNRTRRSAPTEDFKADPGFTYYEKDLCVPNPCLFGGTCSKDNSNKEFLCSCMPRYKGSLCEIEPLGWSSRRPGKSCKDIKSSGDGIYDGRYWIDPEKSGNAMQVYCDMSHEGGGWLLVTNVVIPDPASTPSLTKMRTSYRDIADYNDNKTVITATALGQLHQHINFTQLRFQCRQAGVGRTVHVITAANTKGYDVVKFYTAASNTRPQACDTFYRGDGDDSMLAAQCNLWSNGRWGSASRLNDKRLNDHTFYVPNKYHWMTYSRVECDLKYKSLSPGDYWKIFVR